MRALLSVLVLSVLAIACRAESGATFTGKWRLDPLRSRLENAPEGKDVYLTIDQKGSTIRITTNAEPFGAKGGAECTLDLTTDGVDHEETIDGRKAAASVRWDPSAARRLVWEVKSQDDAGPVDITREATVGEKGKILTTILRVKDHRGERTAYEFYSRE